MNRSVKSADTIGRKSCRNRAGKDHHNFSSDYDAASENMMKKHLISHFALLLPRLQIAYMNNIKMMKLRIHVRRIDW